MPANPGQMLLHYRLLEKIGEGGMGVVWKALDTTLDREVAIKILPETFAQNPERLARFEREAKLLASLNHPHIATVHGLHETPQSRHSVNSGLSIRRSGPMQRFLLLDPGGAGSPSYRQGRISSATSAAVR